MITIRRQKVKVLHTDGGSEFLNKEFDDYLQEHGILRQTTETATSASNGAAENAIRVIANNVRTMRMSCDVPINFWGHAVRYAGYIRNRIPCKANDGWTQPAVAIDKNKMTKITENESEINKDGIKKPTMQPRRKPKDNLSAAPASATSWNSVAIALSTSLLAIKKLSSEPM